MTEVHGRAAAHLRTSTGRAGTISATDAVVAAFAAAFRTAVVLTSDPEDLAALLEGHPSAVIVSLV
ncbi:MAG: hypothetical protein KDB17_03730 [Ilumatobacter sp.]|nr:hypothetical protein [Ilumatobacter sp.]